MASTNYFRYIPDFEYISRGPDQIGSSDFTKVKNFFIRGKIREDIYQNITAFDRYIIEGDDRPDNVAYKIYGDTSLDWVILLANNILDVYSEWPLSQLNFDAYLLEKYGNYQSIYAVKHYETLEIKDSQGTVIVPAGLKISEKYIDLDKTIVQREVVFNPFINQNVVTEITIPNPNYLKLKPTYFQFFDYGTGKDTLYTGVTKEITNYDYEVDLNEKKRQIFVLKRDYLGILLDQMDENLEYKKGSKQYVSRTLKRASTLDFED